MLKINLSHQSRRSFLTAGTLGLGGFMLSDLLRTKALANTPAMVRNKSVVLLFLGGGPPQHETFDPKMSAPSAYRAMFGETKTRLPGITFGHHFPGLARNADKLAIIRSFKNGMSSHGSATAYMAAGGNATKAHLGSLYSSIAGTTNPRTGMPNNIMLGPRAAGAGFVGNPDYTQRLNPANDLGTAYAPFDPSGGGQLISDMKLGIKTSRLDDRRSLLTGLDQLKRNLDNSGELNGIDKFNAQAFDLLLQGVTSAFDLSKEPAAILEKYDTSHIKIPAEVFARKPKRKGFDQQTPEFLGRQMLLARRMIEAVCGLVGRGTL